MSITYVGNNSVGGAGVTELDLSNPAGAVAGELIVSCFAFEGVAANSGPWIVPNIGQLSTNYIGPFTNWEQVCWQTPGTTGVGIEVWCAILFSGTVQWAKFAASQNAVAVNVAYSGIYNAGNPVTNGTVRLATTQQVTGNRPAAPSVTANAGEQVIAIGGDTMTASGFGSPSGFTSRIDVTRGGAGSVEAVIADAPITTPGATGPITFPQNASSSTAPGATATLAIRPAPSVAGTGGVIDAGLPQDLDIGPGYSLQVAALDPITGNPVSGVTVSNLVFTADQISGTPEQLEVGPFLLVPGPNA